MSPANATPSGQRAPGPEPPEVPGLDAREQDAFALMLSVVVQLPPSHVVVDVTVAVPLICVVNIELSAPTHWLTLLVLT
jgi:hypothetical protein